MNPIIRGIIQLPFVQNLLRGQITTLAGVGATWIITHVPGTTYTQQGVDGALACLGLVALQAAENYVAGPKAPLNTPAPEQPK